MATPLRPYSWEVLREGARRWAQQHPTRFASGIDREERLTSFIARAAFAVATADTFRAGIEVGAAPCLKCGLWTHSFCEGCSVADLGPICTTCDGHFLLCPVCERAGLTWQGCRDARIAQQGPQPVMEISGIRDSEGRWRPFNPPVEIPIAEFEQQDQDLETFATAWLQEHGFVEREEPDPEDGC